VFVYYVGLTVIKSTKFSNFLFRWLYLFIFMILMACGGMDV